MIDTFKRNPMKQRVLIFNLIQLKGLNVQTSINWGITMIKHTYTVLMDPDVNALSGLPKIVRFQIMTALALMWSVIFCAWTGALALIGPSMAVHSLILLGIFFTADIFRRMERTQLSDHRTKYKDPRDGCARYDDLWGG